MENGKKTAEAEKSATASSKLKREQTSDEEDDDDAPILKRKKTRAGESDEDDEPIAKRKPPPANKKENNSSTKKTPVKKATPAGKNSRSDSSDSEDEPIAKKKKALKTDTPKSAPSKKNQSSKSRKEESSSSDDSDSSSGDESDESTSKSSKKKAQSSDSDSDVPIAKAKKKVPPKSSEKSSAAKPKKQKKSKSSDDDSDVPIAKKKKPQAADKKKPAGSEKKVNGRASEKGRRSSKGEKTDEEEGVKQKKPSKLQQEEEFIYKWWTEDEQKLRKLKEAKGVKWLTLQHHGVLFPPMYEPHGIKILYDGKPVALTPEAEEVATMYAAMLESDYTKKKKFNENFWNDWSKVLQKSKKKGEKHVIQSLEKCDFTPIFKHLQELKEKKKNITKEEKKATKEAKAKQEQKFTVALVDGHKEKVGNFRVEPPGLFRGRGEHPKMGRLKARILPEDVTINIGEDADVPVCPVPGHKWKEVKHDNTVTWLAHWKDTINDQDKYVWLAATSSFKGMSDFDKYEKARKLKDYIDKIRKDYTRDLKAQDEQVRQRATALYLIDRLALRVGNEKDTDEEADTVGCCSLRLEHIQFNPDAEEITLDFLGKDSIQYTNTVKVDKQVFNNLQGFADGKKPDEDLFDRLNTGMLNAYLKELMPGLTAKVFRTYNASITLDRLLSEASFEEDDTVNMKLVEYNRANREVAILCNHQRAVPKNHGAQMEKMNEKIADLDDQIERLEKYKKQAKKTGGAVEVEEVVKPKKAKDKEGGTQDDTSEPEVKQKKMTHDQIAAKIAKVKEQIEKQKSLQRIKDDNKTVSLGTSKINYMDPRITAAWCKKHDVPISKIFNASLQAKFMWAMDVDEEYRF